MENNSRRWKESETGDREHKKRKIRKEKMKKKMIVTICRAQWLRGRAPDSRLREPTPESCAAVLKPWANFSLSIAPVHSAV